MATPPAVILTDIEGTTSRISFVHDVLFPYARAGLPDFLARRGGEPDVAAVLAEVRALAPDAAPIDTLLAWMDADAKVTPLKALQGLIWGEGYATGALHGELYPDVAPALRLWHAHGVLLYVYSSGSVAAQKMLFGHTADGDLTGLFSGFFDTRIGGKRAASSYAAIALEIGVPAGEILFLSDVAAELDAAQQAGLRVCQLVRPQDGTVAGAHWAVADFGALVEEFRQGK